MYLCYIQLSIYYLYRKRRKISYAELQNKRAEAWSAVTTVLQDSYIKELVLPEDKVCSVCCEVKAVYRCLDCGPWMTYCKECCMSQHSRSCFLHVPEKWERGEFVPVMLMNVEIPLNHHCSAVFKERITIISLKGLSLRTITLEYTQ